MKQRDVNWLNKKLKQGITRERVNTYLLANYSQAEIDKFMPKEVRPSDKTKESEDG